MCKFLPKPYGVILVEIPEMNKSTILFIFLVDYPGEVAKPGPTNSDFQSGTAVFMPRPGPGHRPGVNLGPDTTHG